MQKLTQYQIDLFWFSETQTEFINWIIDFCYSQWMNKWIEEIQALKNNQ
jgi:hypothetical protein